MTAGSAIFLASLNFLEITYKIIKTKAMVAIAKMKKPTLCRREYFIINKISYIF